MANSFRVLAAAGRVLVGLVVAAGVASLYLTRDPRPWFTRRHAAVSEVRERVPEIDGTSVLQRVRLTATSGLAVDVTLRREIADTGRRLPTAVVLGGHLTGAEAARLVGPVPGVLVVAMSYPFDGNPRPSAIAFLRQIPAIRGAFLDTPPALRVVLDYLVSRPEVDTTRIEAIGVSLGAPFVTIAGALDERFSRVWALHGSGGSYAPLEMSMRRSIGLAPVRKASAAIASVIIAGPRLAPERWVAGISPRPFVMVNATGDERLPMPAVERLYEAAGQPKEIIWMAGGHIHGDAETIRRLVAIVMSRISQAG
jgi:fermentation-respiration switch protein FrsA (DUF1100 family)